MFETDDEELAILPKLMTPKQKSVDKILAHAELRRYQRLCWQLAAILTASLLLDVVLIIWLIRLGS